jgi:peptidyl-prolyl cis-trans isomerase B (cyclophilin B)
MNAHRPSHALLVAAALLAACSDTAAPPPPSNPPPAAAQNTPPAAAPKPAAPATPIEAMEQFIAEQKVEKTEGWKTRLRMPPKLTFDDKTYFWRLDTNKGAIKLKLFTKTAPMHASSTIYLTKLGFYDGLTFHRVIPGFMAQGGDPLGTGRGSPGYRYDGEFEPLVSHTKPGMLSMANGGRNTDGSQFFITFIPKTDLDNKHTVFGEVVDGMDAVRALEQCGNPDRKGGTTERLEIKTATIVVE